MGKRSYQMHCLFRSNVSDVKMVPLMPYRTNIMSILGHKVFYTKLEINSMSIMTGTVAYTMTQKDHKHRLQKCDFH